MLGQHLRLADAPVQLAELALEQADALLDAAQRAGLLPGLPFDDLQLVDLSDQRRALGIHAGRDDSGCLFRLLGCAQARDIVLSLRELMLDVLD